MNDSPFSLFVGLDVSSNKIDVAWQNGLAWESQVIANTWPDTQAFAAQLYNIFPQACCIVEYTGTYSSKIALALFQAGLKISLITPTQSKSFAKMRHKTTKNDQSDARLLAEFGKSNVSQLRFYTPLTEQQLQFKQLIEVVEQLEQMRQQIRNRIHAYAQLPPQHQQQVILDSYQNTEKQLDREIEDLYQILRLQDHHDEDMNLTKQLMTTVKGIGEKTSNVILAKTQGIKRFKSPKELSKFAGLSPTENNSGSSIRGRRGINRSGNASIRKALYCATWSALRYNKACRALYDRLRAKGKPAKVALIAVANLLIRQIFAVVTTQKPFVNELYSQMLTP